MITEPYLDCWKPIFLRECPNDKLKYTLEIKEKTVRLLLESEKDYPSNWAAITALAHKFGCTLETLRSWHKKHMG
ncbi:hypothetical protein [Acinetobacter terrae]|uniref:hypothetical protein n=1 Tax=Acinetobacter terrae TaxID=2731247 RepID=UPI003EB9C455